MTEHGSPAGTPRNPCRGGEKRVQREELVARVQYGSGIPDYGGTQVSFGTAFGIGSGIGLCHGSRISEYRDPDVDSAFSPSYLVLFVTVL